MNLSEMFQSNVISVEPEATIECVVHKMKQDNVGAVVVTKDGNVAGIVTDRDIAFKLALNEAGPGTPVNEIMSKNVITIWDDQGVFNATQYLQGHKIRRLPIIDRSNRLVGMVTTDDLFALLAREFFNVVKAIEPALAIKSF